MRAAAFFVQTAFAHADARLPRQKVTGIFEPAKTCGIGEFLVGIAGNAVKFPPHDLSRLPSGRAVQVALLNDRTVPRRTLALTRCLGE